MKVMLLALTEGEGFATVTVLKDGDYVRLTWKQTSTSPEIQIVGILFKSYDVNHLLDVMRQTELKQARNLICAVKPQAETHRKLERNHKPHLLWITRLRFQHVSSWMSLSKMYKAQL